jgi:hypothetical protein
MIRSLSCFLAIGALLTAVPLFSASTTPGDPLADKGTVHWFRLTETRDQVVRMMGPPRNVSRMGDDLEAWQYQLGVSDEHEFSHQFVFRVSTGELISATRLYENDRDVEELFAAGNDAVYWLTNSDGSKYGVRVTHLPGNRLLLAPGSSAKGKPASQLFLVRASELGRFFPWLADELARSRTQQK